MKVASIVCILLGGGIVLAVSGFVMGVGSVRMGSGGLIAAGIFLLIGGYALSVLSSDVPDRPAVAAVRGPVVGEKVVKEPDIFEAVKRGHLGDVRGLIDRDPTVVSFKGYRGRSPLHYAVEGGQREIAELLLAKGAGLEVRDVDGRTPVDLADLIWQTDLARALRLYGTPPPFVELVNEIERHPGAFGAGLGSAEALLKMSPGVVGTKDGDGRTLLHWAAGAGAKGFAELLLTEGANGDAADGHGRTPLHFAARSGSKSVVELLLAKGAGFKSKDESGFTPLIAAARNCTGKGQLEVLELLCKLENRTPSILDLVNGILRLIRELEELTVPVESASQLRGINLSIYAAAMNDQTDKVNELERERNEDIRALEGKRDEGIAALKAKIAESTEGPETPVRVPD